MKFAFSFAVCLLWLTCLSQDGSKTRKSPISNFRMWGGLGAQQSRIDGQWQAGTGASTTSFEAAELLAGGMGMHLGLQLELFDAVHAGLLWQGDRIDALPLQGIVDQRIYQQSVRLRVGVDLLKHDMFSWFVFMGLHPARMGINTQRQDSAGTFVTETTIFASKIPGVNFGTGATMFFKDESAGILFEVGYQDVTLEARSFERTGSPFQGGVTSGSLVMRGFEGRIGLAVRLNHRN
jgi:hypothetical protein